MSNRTDQAQDAKPLRADARRNRESVLKAARKCFAKNGLDAQMDDIAAAAGLGVGTVYRHFPTKDALVRALVADRFQQLAGYAREALESDDPWAGFEQFMWRSGRLVAEDRALSQVIGEQSADVREGAVVESGLPELTEELIKRAQAAGVLRPDVVMRDVPMIMCGLGRMMGGMADDGSWERYLALAVDGMRARDAAPLPERR